MQAEFGRFQDLTEKWFVEGKKKHLKRAYKSAKVLVPFLAGLPALPEGLDPLQLASQIIGLAQKPKHVQIGIPLIHAALEKYMIDGAPFSKSCDEDEASMRRSCQDVHVLLCSALHRTNQINEAEKWVQKYNERKPAWRQFDGVAGIHRQIPGIKARPWLTADELPPAHPGCRCWPSRFH